MVSGTIDAGSTPAGSIAAPAFISLACRSMRKRRPQPPCISTKPTCRKGGQHQSQWILMKDAALDKDPQSIIFKVFIAVG